MQVVLELQFMTTFPNETPLSPKRNGARDRLSGAYRPVISIIPLLNNYYDLHIICR